MMVHGVRPGAEALHDELTLVPSRAWGSATVTVPRGGPTLYVAADGSIVGGVVEAARLSSGVGAYAMLVARFEEAHLLWAGG